ncbi:hypothetical protein [Streptomyces yaizuensis]|uniref:Uncharacterized protein n=1 Tax=Streptomyces yaizuensis TaxID=2989713 RepID=A0ABQ5P1Z3_9ACTN|nr:hypothetical protein [Streptomyces sp. YSPA8]GLF96628.1 hypothetical protein SYYSPA8_20045 [Streptomyces sp. YSPA8]
MVILARPGQPADDSPVRHSGPSRRTLLTVAAVVGTLLLGGGTLVVQRYNDRPPRADDIAYESGYLYSNRIRQADHTGELVRKLLNGECVLLEAEGYGGTNATYNPQLWVEGCLDGAAGRPSREQGLIS